MMFLQEEEEEDEVMVEAGERNVTPQNIDQRIIALNNSVQCF